MKIYLTVTFNHSPNKKTAIYASSLLLVVTGAGAHSSFRACNARSRNVYCLLCVFVLSSLVAFISKFLDNSGRRSTRDYWTHSRPLHVSCTWNRRRSRPLFLTLYWTFSCTECGLDIQRYGKKIILHYITSKNNVSYHYNKYIDSPYSNGYNSLRKLIFHELFSEQCFEFQSAQYGPLALQLL